MRADRKLGPARRQAVPPVHALRDSQRIGHVVDPITAAANQPGAPGHIQLSRYVEHLYARGLLDDAGGGVDHLLTDG